MGEQKEKKGLDNRRQYRFFARHIWAMRKQGGDLGVLKNNGWEAESFQGKKMGFLFWQDDFQTLPVENTF